MSRPVNVDKPCAGDAFVASIVASDTDDCDDCAHYVDHGSKCLGPDGWPFLAIAALDQSHARVAKLERGLTDIANFGGEDFGRQPVDNAHHLAFVKDIALAALETPDE